MPYRSLAAVLALVAAAPLPAAGPTGEEKLAGLIGGRTAGQPISCIPEYRTNRSYTIDKIGVVYDVGPTRYVMRFKDGCDQLTEFTLFSTSTPTQQLCEGDFARIYQNGPPNIFLGTCIIGQFVPYKRDGVGPG